MVTNLKKITLIEFLDFMGIALMYPEYAKQSSLDEMERYNWKRDHEWQPRREIRERAKAQIDALLLRDDVAGICIFENLDMWSSNLGESSALAYGPGCTYKTIDDLKGQHLGDVPSRFKYPTQYYEKEQA